MLKFHLNNRKVIRAGIFLLLVSATVGWASTTSASRTVIEPLRIGAISLVAILALLSAIRNGQIARRAGGAIFAYAALLAYGLLLSTIHGGFELGVQQLHIWIAMTLTALYLFSSSKGAVISTEIAKSYLIFSLAILGLTIFWGGLVLGAPPEFVFDRYSRSGSQVLYSQGISKFFGIAAISAVYLAYVATTVTRTYVYLAATILCLALSLLGGARGDSIAAIAVVALFLGWKRPVHLALLAGIALVTWSLVPSGAADNLIILQRISAVGEGNFGMRDRLFVQAINLLGNEPKCLFFGCGFGYFQSYYSYDAGLYPHNFALEFAIVYGLPLTLVLFAAGAVGLVKAQRVDGRASDAMILFFGYFLLVSMKSGDVLSAWFLYAAMLHYGAIAVVRRSHPDRREA